MKYDNAFRNSSRPHILMITNHGIHQWQIIPGLPDTGGQNVFVNEFTASLAKKGFKITIVNRGGYKHPVSGEPRAGLHYKDENQRILYLEDDKKSFVRKEDMDEQLPALAKALQNHLAAEGLSADLIISHYWDGAKLGILFNKSQKERVGHVWVPHSLGAIKKRNVNPEQWAGLRIDERIKNEEEIISTVDRVAATSATIRHSLKEDYSYNKPPLFLPPSIDPGRYFPHEVMEDHPIWSFLSERCGLTPSEIFKNKVITEISRTDKTKRKSILIKAFSEVIQDHPDSVLVVSIDQSDNPLSRFLIALIEDLDITKHVAVVGSVWDQLPDIYAATDIYCTPSIMEGFGMTSQEAAATAVPVIASNLVPFATEYLLGDSIEEVKAETGEGYLQVGQGAIVAAADDVGQFAQALDILLSNPNQRKEMGKKAYEITIPYFTWDNVVGEFLKDIQYLIPGHKAS
jgi:glycosyltransferase involved in cell wall biosynthesis